MNVGATVSILKSTQILGHLFLHTATILHQNSALSPLNKNKQKIKIFLFNFENLMIFQNGEITKSILQKGDITVFDPSTCKAGFVVIVDL